MTTVSITGNRPDASVTTVLLGTTTVVAQALLLREAMAAMGGSEMAWGLVMALWLVGMGTGARIGVRLGTFRLASTMPLLTLVLAAGGILLFRAAPAVLGAAPGETLTTWHSAWLWALAVIPAAFAGGLAFPIFADELGPRGPGRAYALEAVGALVGGLALSFAVIRLGTAAAALFFIGGTGAVLVWARSRISAALVFAVCAVLAIPAAGSLARATWRWAGHPGELGAWAETRHQRLESSIGPPFSLYADGRLEASYPDPYTTLPRAHLLMLLHPRPDHVLAIGCLADGSVEAIVRHPVRSLVLIEEDPRLAPLLGRWFGPIFGDTLAHPSIRARWTESLRIRAGPEPLDLVILRDGDPTSLKGNRTRTAEFFRRCRSLMADDAMIIVEVGVSDTYLGGDAGLLLATLHSTLRRVFSTVAAVPGERVLLIAGGTKSRITTDLAVLESRLAARPEVAEVLPAAMLAYLVDPTRIPALASFLDTTTAHVNTIGHPRAVAVAANLHESRSRSNLARALADLQPDGPTILRWLLAAAVLALLGTGVVAPVRWRAVASAWTVGCCSMGWWLLLLASWQATKGSVYAEIGALTAAFMVGVAGGGWVGVRARDPRRIVGWLLAAGAVLSLVLATGLPRALPGAAVPGLMVAGGLLTGAAFPGLGALAGGTSGRRGAGLAFAADEIGAATAALIVGTAAIPWVGMTWSAIGLAILGTAAIPAARHVGHR
jgi:predicted membrane-bound spermidine synthase